jgi:hypothetical protein
MFPVLSRFLLTLFFFFLSLVRHLRRSCKVTLTLALCYGLTLCASWVQPLARCPERLWVPLSTGPANPYNRSRRGGNWATVRQIEAAPQTLWRGRWRTPARMRSNALSSGGGIPAKAINSQVMDARSESLALLAVGTRCCQSRPYASPTDVC